MSRAAILAVVLALFAGAGIGWVAHDIISPTHHASNGGGFGSAANPDRSINCLLYNECP